MTTRTDTRYVIGRSVEQARWRAMEYPESSWFDTREEAEELTAQGEQVYPVTITVGVAE